MKKKVVKNLLLKTIGSFENQIDHTPYDRFGNELLGEVIKEAYKIEAKGGTIDDVVHAIVGKYVK